MILNVVLQAAGKGDIMSTVLMFGALIAIMYFFMFRPQQKKQKALQEARNAIKTGDKVITADGIHGRIREIKETYFVVEIAENVKVKVAKNFVHPLATPPEEGAKTESK